MSGTYFTDHAEATHTMGRACPHCGGEHVGESHVSLAHAHDRLHQAELTCLYTKVGVIRPTLFQRIAKLILRRETN